MRRKIQGHVEVEALVDTRGNLTDVRVTKPLDAELDLEAVAAERRWRFDPATVNGETVPIAVTLVLSFTIH